MASSPAGRSESGGYCEVSVWRANLPTMGVLSSQIDASNTPLRTAFLLGEVFRNDHQSATANKNIKTV